MSRLHSLGPLRLALAAVAGLALALAIGFYLPLARERVCFPAPHPLVAIMRPAPAGWMETDRAVGATEQETTTAAELLRYDDAFVKVYRKGSTEVIVYVAYWGPARMDPRLIVGHTPDTCWIMNGATMVSRDDRYRLAGSDGAPLVPCYYRTFDWSGVKNQVVFWHLYGGRRSTMVLDNGLGNDPGAPGKLAKALESLKESGFGTIRNDQVFVRISTNGTMDELVRSDLWPTLMASLRPTGIANG